MTPILETLSQVLLLGASIVFLVHVIRGSSIFDRILAVETLALAVVGFLLLASRGEDAGLYLDAAMGVALFSFMGAVFLAYFLGEGELDE